MSHEEFYRNMPKRAVATHRPGDTPIFEELRREHLRRRVDEHMRQFADAIKRVGDATRAWQIAP